MLDFSRQPAFRLVQHCQRILGCCPFLQPFIDIFHISRQGWQVGFTPQRQGEATTFGTGILCIVQRDEQAAKRFLTKAIRRHGVPEKITIDGSAANEAAIKSYNQEHGTAIAIRQVKYLNNIVE